MSSAADIDLPSSILRGMKSSSDTVVNIPVTTVSSPTFNIPTVSDLTPTEHDEEREQPATRHDTFYFGDGNVEILCGGTVFRVHSTVISFPTNSETFFPHLPPSVPRCRKGVLELLSMTTPRTLRSC